MSVTAFTSYTRIWPMPRNPRRFMFTESAYATGDGSAGYVRITATGMATANGVLPTDHVTLFDVAFHTSDTNAMTGAIAVSQALNQGWSGQGELFPILAGTGIVADLDGSAVQQVWIPPPGLLPLYLGPSYNGYNQRTIQAYWATNTNAKVYRITYRAIIDRPPEMV